MRHGVFTQSRHLSGDSKKGAKFVSLHWGKATTTQANKTPGKASSMTSPSHLYNIGISEGVLLSLTSQSVPAMHLFTASRSCAFSKAAATRSLSFSCLLTIQSQKSAKKKKKDPLVS